MAVPPIELSVPLRPPLAPVERRYYTRLYNSKENSASNRQCVMVHSNRICIVTLSPEHVVIKEDKRILRVNYQVSLRAPVTLGVPKI